MAPRDAVAVAGLWHLGCVTAACLASREIDVLGYDSEPKTIAKLETGRAPVFEPGLDELLARGVATGYLRFSSKRDDLKGRDIVWATWDTPVDEDDRADVEFVFRELESLFPALSSDCLVVLSSQLPVGSTRGLEGRYRSIVPGGAGTFAYVPENLRLGQAIDTFTRADRVVLGVRSERDALRLRALLAPFDLRTEVMRVESAEMTKHALNTFLATSIVFANEVASLAERVGADAREVERGLKTDVRIGPRAYVRPGAAYSGGTLARDVSFLVALGQQQGRSMPLLSGVRESNETHKRWAYDALERALGDLRGKRIGVLGLTYKPGTNTLRRSAAVWLCHEISEAGGHPVVYDPVVNVLPVHFEGSVVLAGSVSEALRGSAAVVIATEWPEFRSLSADELAEHLSGERAVIDAGAFLGGTLLEDRRVRYYTVGTVN